MSGERGIENKQLGWLAFWTWGSLVGGEVKDKLVCVDCRRESFGLIVAGGWHSGVWEDIKFACRL